MIHLNINLLYFRKSYKNALINYGSSPKNILCNFKYNVPIDNINEIYIIILWY